MNIFLRELLVLGIATALTACGGGIEMDSESDGALASGEQEMERGPNNGRLLRDDAMADELAGMITDLEPNEKAMRKAAGDAYSTATDLADWLVRVLGLPFRRAHHVTGALVKVAEDKGCGLEDLALDDMRAVEAGITEDVFAVLGVENSVKSRTSLGGTAPERVRDAAAKAREILDSHFPSHIPADVDARIRERFPIRLPEERMRDS